MRIFLMIYSILFIVPNVSSQNRQYTIALWDNASHQLFQKKIQIDYDSINNYIKKCIEFEYRKAQSNERSNSNQKNGGSVLVNQNGSKDTIPFQDYDANYYYAYIGDTVINYNIKLPYLLGLSQESDFLFYRKDDSINMQKIMIDSLLPGEWVRYKVNQGGVYVDVQKSIKDNRVDGALISYDENGNFSWIQIFKNGIRKEFYTFYDEKHPNTLTRIFVPEKDFSKTGFHIDFENGRIKDIDKQHDTSYLRFDSSGRIMGGSILGPIK